MVKLQSKISTFEELKTVDKEAYKAYKYLVSDDNYEILNKNMDYLGFGILLTSNGMYVLVAEKEDSYMTLKPLALFNITNYHIPDIWEVTSGNYFDSPHYKVYCLYTFKEWSNDPLFYEKLIDGDDKMEKLFKNIKKEYYG
jgi:hypothetical protein